MEGKNKHPKPSEIMLNSTKPGKLVVPHRCMSRGVVMETKHLILDSGIGPPPRRDAISENVPASSGASDVTCREDDESLSTVAPSTNASELENVGETTMEGFSTETVRADIVGTSSESLVSSTDCTGLICRPSTLSELNDELGFGVKFGVSPVSFSRQLVHPLSPRKGTVC